MTEEQRLAAFIQEQIQDATRDIWETSATRDVEISEMRRDFTHMQNNLQHEIHQLSIRLAALEARPATVVTSQSSLFSKPTEFEGKNEEFSAWLSQILTYIACNPQQFAHERTKVLFACSRIKGDVYSHVQAIAESSHTGAPLPELDNFRLFVDKLRRIFGPVDEAGDAQTKMRALSQGSRTVEEYAAQFNLLAAKTGWDQVALLSEFQRGLSSKIREAMVMHKFEDLETIIRTASEVDSKLRAIKRPAHRSSAPAAADPNAMDIGSMRASGQRQCYPLAPEEERRRGQLGLCFKCGKG